MYCLRSNKSWTPKAPPAGTLNEGMVANVKRIVARAVSSKMRNHAQGPGIVKLGYQLVKDLRCDIFQNDKDGGVSIAHEGVMLNERSTILPTIGASG